LKVTGIIPARFNSTRLPGKPLAMIKGVSMIQRVYEQAKKASLLDRVIVATDDVRIFNHIQNFGGEVVMTSENHQSGTDRCFEAAIKSEISEDDELIINIQGDEPFIDPEQINLLVSCFDDKTNLATLVKKITDSEDIFNSAKPKVVFTNDFKAIYFSRSPIPYVRESEKENWLQKSDFYKHIGIYGYRFKTLKEITSLTESKLEAAECLEQLRWIENGFEIKVAVTESESIAIDTPDDLQKVNL
jgi:3-deoxy-manno-octulosonate cytidylyltransferase (CMP-KDO synthetase)